MTEFQNTGQPNQDWWRELWPDPATVLQQLGLTEDQPVADMCSGNGYFTLPVANLVGDAPVYTIDLDAMLLAELRSWAAEHPCSVKSMTPKQFTFEVVIHSVWASKLVFSTTPYRLLTEERGLTEHK